MGSFDEAFLVTLIIAALVAGYVLKKLGDRHED